MLFQVYGENALYQWLGWFLVFFGLIGLNEVARRTRVAACSCSWLCPSP